MSQAHAHSAYYWTDLYLDRCTYRFTLMYRRTQALLEDKSRPSCVAESVRWARCIS